MRKDPTELDLHGYTVRDALDKFVRAYNAHVQSGRKGKIVVVHGFKHGQEVRNELRRFLTSEQIDFSEDLRNDGRTVVFPGARPILFPGAGPIRGQSALMRRQEIFREVVRRQNSGLSESKARRWIAIRFRMPQDQVRRIELEGKKEQWPLPAEGSV